jgi:elongation factor Ts
MMDCKKALSESEGDMDKAVEWLRKKGLSGADKKAGRVAAEGAVVKYIHPGSRIGILMEVNCETDFVAASDEFRKLCAELCMIAASSDVVCVSAEEVPADLLAKEREIEMGKADLATKPEGVRAKIVEGRLDKLKKQWALLEQDALTLQGTKVEDLVKATIAKVGENVRVRRFIKYTLGEGIEKKASNLAAEVAEQTAAMAAKAAEAAAKKEEPKKEEAPAAPKQPAVAVSASAVKALRDKSGAGMMDCKKALAENGGDVEKASEWLRKKGLAGADKKAGRVAAEGAVVEYIHPGSRVGVLLELNCETDFVAAGEVFTKLAKALAMQIAASPTVEFVSADEIPSSVFEAEMTAEMAREDIASKPEAIRAKIAEGRVKKIVAERALLDQPYLVDQSKTVAEAIKEAIAACGEKISVRRFTRYVLGEGIEKKSTDLAADVAAMAAGKA